MIDKPFLGGGQKALLLLAKNLDRRRFEVFVSSAPEGPLVEEVEKYGIPHLPIPIRKRWKAGLLKEISAVLREHKIDILHTHGGIAGLYGRYAARSAEIPVVVHTLHGIHYLHYRNILLRYASVLLEKLFSRTTDALIFVGSSDLQRGKRLKLAAEEKMFLIHNGVEFPLAPGQGCTKAEDTAWLKALGSPIVGTIARLHRQKGIAYLLQAAPRIERIFPEFRIVIIGNGPLRLKLERMAQRLKLSKIVHFLGERDDAISLLSCFDVFVLPSLWEGLPFVLIEAAIQQRPIVATEVDGVPEIIEHGRTGLLVPPKDPEALAEAVIRLLHDMSLATDISAEAARVVPSRFPLSEMVEKTQALYLKFYHKKAFGRSGS